MSDLTDLLRFGADAFLPTRTTETTTRSIPAALQAQLDALTSTLQQRSQSAGIPEDRIQQLLASAVQTSAERFAPNRVAPRLAGGYNSASQQLVENDAQARASDAALNAVLTQLQRNEELRNQVSQVLSQHLTTSGQLTGTTTVDKKTQPKLGGAAMPLLGLGLVKSLANYAGAGKAAGKSVGSSARFGQAAPTSSVMAQVGLPGIGASMASDELLSAADVMNTDSFGLLNPSFSAGDIFGGAGNPFGAITAANPMSSITDLRMPTQGLFDGFSDFGFDGTLGMGDLGGSMFGGGGDFFTSLLGAAGSSSSNPFVSALFNPVGMFTGMVGNVFSDIFGDLFG